MIDIALALAFVALGSVVGFFAGLLGVGGGGIMVPVLTVIFLQQEIHIDTVMHLALGTSMASIIITSLSSLLAHQKHNAINWKLVKLMSIGVMMGTFLSTFLASHLSSFYLAIFFTAFMGYVALKMLCKKQTRHVVKDINISSLIFSSTGIGAVSALVSIGGGSLIVPFLTSKSVDIKKAIATSAALGLPISMAGTLGYLINGWNSDFDYNHSFGFVYLPAVFLISIASFLTAPYGAKLVQHLPVNVLKNVFAFLLITLSLKMLSSII